MKKKKQRHPWTERILHWSYAPAVLTCIFSGLYIHKPAGFYGFKSMDSARKTHFMAQFVLLFSFLARVCYGLRDQNYRELLPNRKAIRDIPKFFRYELFLTNKEPKFPKYSPGQKIIFAGFTFFALIQILSGLPLYFSNSWQRMAERTGGLNPLRFLHFISALALASLVSGHIYFALTHGLKKVKSMITGYE